MRKVSAAPLAQHVRKVYRERGTLGAHRGPAFLQSTLLPDQLPHSQNAGSDLLPTKSLGSVGRADGGCAGPSPSSPARVIRTGESRGFGPGPLACKVAARSSSAVAEPLQDTVVGLVLGWWWGRLPYFSGVRASRPEQRSWRIGRVTGVGPALSAWNEFLVRLSQTVVTLREGRLGARALEINRTQVWGAGAKMAEARYPPAVAGFQTRCSLGRDTMVRVGTGPRAVEFKSIKKLNSRFYADASKGIKISVADQDVPAWQRQTVWTTDEMGLLALSIIQNYPIGLVILWKKSDGVRVPIDGRQRLTAIQRFRAGECAIPDLPGVPTHYKNRKYKLQPGDNPQRFTELELEDQEEFDDYEPQILEYEHIDESTAMDIFIKLQGGKSLTKTGVRAALGGRVCDFVTELTSPATSKSESDDEEDEPNSHHQFFRQVNIRNVRKAHRNLCDVMLHEQLFPGKNKHWAALDALYRDKAKSLTDREMAQFKTTLERFRKACLVPVGGRSVLLPQLRSAFLILTFFRAWQEVEEVFAKPPGYSFAGLIAKFETNRETYKQKVPWVNFSAALSNAGYSEGRLNERHDILMSFILREHPGMALKDRKRRTFAEAQKIAIWDRAGHRCEFETAGVRCAEEFADFREADADHFVRWVDGGPTTLDNGRLLCTKHNRGRGKVVGKTAVVKKVGKKVVRPKLDLRGK